MDENPEMLPLFGGLSGAQLGTDEFEICDGLVLRQTYAHVMSPYILAFARPEAPGKPHPGPWKPARGGQWLDLEIELALREGVRPTGFDRLNTLWWVLALLRLATGANLRMPVVSDTSLSATRDAPVDPIIWPIETLPRQLLTISDPPKVIDKSHLLWVRQAFVPGSKLMNDLAFGRSLQTLDGAIWAHSTGSAIIVIWAALETLMQPGQPNTTKRLSSILAALLEPAGAERDRLFQQIRSLYKARSSSAHASRSPAAQQLFESFEIARRAFVYCIDNGQLPNASRLHEMWRLKE